MKIRVTIDDYEYMGLMKGSVHENVRLVSNGQVTFTANGRKWYLTPSMYEVVKEDIRGAVPPDEAQGSPDKTETKKESVLDIQHGGSHYKDKGIQPIEYIVANNLDFCQGNIVKYVTRHKNKNGAEDVRKIIHYAQFILKFEYGEEI